MFISRKRKATTLGRSFVYKRAFREAAERYQDPLLSPLQQSFEEIQEEFHQRRFLKALLAGQIVGSLRDSGTIGVDFF